MSETESSERVAELRKQVLRAVEQFETTETERISTLTLKYVQDQHSASLESDNLTALRTKVRELVQQLTITSASHMRAAHMIISLRERVTELENNNAELAASVTVAEKGRAAAQQTAESFRDAHSTEAQRAAALEAAAKAAGTESRQNDAGAAIYRDQLQLLTARVAPAEATLAEARQAAAAAAEHATAAEAKADLVGRELAAARAATETVERDRQAAAQVRRPMLDQCYVFYAFFNMFAMIYLVSQYIADMLSFVLS